MPDSPIESRGRLKLIGTGMSPGRAIGKAFIYHDVSQRDHERYGIRKDQIDSEYARIEQAIQEVAFELETAADTVGRDLNPQLGDIFRAYQTMLRAPSLGEEIKCELREELINAEQVVRRVFHRWIHRFKSLNHSQLPSRTEDLDDLSRRLLRSLRGIQAHELHNLPKGSVLVTRRLLPSDTIYLLQKSVVAVVVSEGGPGSHAALLTREIGIPAVTQLGNAVEKIIDGETLLVDGSSGEVYIAPDQKVKTSFEESIRQSRLHFVSIRNRAREVVETSDGKTVNIMANVGTREDSAIARQCGADGIGLYRTDSLTQEPTSRSPLYTCRARLIRIWEFAVCVSYWITPVS